MSRIEMGYHEGGYAHGGYWDAGSVEAGPGHLGMYAKEWLEHPEMEPRAEYGMAMPYPAYSEQTLGNWERGERKKRPW